MSSNQVIWFSLQSYVDFFSVLTFDYVNYEEITQIASPFSRQQADIDRILESSIPADKLIFNIPIHGITYQLSNAASHGVGAATSGVGIEGLYTKELGFMTYLEVTQFLAANPSATKVYQDSTPYVYSGLNWITFEDQTSIDIKCKYTAVNHLNTGLQLISEDLNTQSQIPNSLTFACRQALNSCLLDLICL